MTSFPPSGQDEKPQIYFGIKHSPYIGNLKEIKVNYSYSLTMFLKLQVFCLIRNSQRPFAGWHICEEQDRDCEGSGADTGGVQTKVRLPWSYNPGYYLCNSRTGTFTKLERPTLVKTIRTTSQLSQAVAWRERGGSWTQRCHHHNYLFVITYPNQTKKKRQVW